MNSSTSPSTSLPSGCLATKSMNDSGSLTGSDGGAPPAPRRPPAARLRAPASRPPRWPPRWRPSTAFLALARLGRLLAPSWPSATATRLVGPRTGVRGREDPADAGHRLAADEPALVEQPLVLAVELLERVVGQHDGVDLVGDAQQEGVAPPDGAGRRRHDLAGRPRLLEGLLLAGVDAVAEGGVDDHGDRSSPGYSLRNARTASSSWARLGDGPAFGRDVRAVDDDVAGRASAVVNALTMPVVRTRRDRRGHRSAPAADPQRLRERRHRPSPGSEARSVDVLRGVPRGHRPRRRDATSPRRAGRRWSPASRAPTRRRPRCCSWATPTWCPPTPTAGSRDPFGGELVDGEVWGRGAVDMLNLTASMAVATKHLADEGFRPAGHARLPRGGRRGGARRPRRRLAHRARARRRRRRLRHHRVRRHPDADRRAAPSCR